MSDDRTQDALDALADLFLTGLAPAAPSEADDAAARKAARAAVRRPAVAESRLDGPAPIRLGPKVRTSAPAATPAADPRTIAPAPSQAAPDPFELIDRAVDALASAGSQLEEAGTETAVGPAPEADAQPAPDTSPAPYLRLRRDDDAATAPRSAGSPGTPAGNAAGDDTAAPAAPPSVLVEAVILGNLPGFGGAWLTQYAGLLAQQDGPVAILHVGDDSLDLELIEPFDEPRPGDELPPASGDPVALLDALARRGRSPVRTVLVHHDATAAGLMDGGLERLLSIGGWTVLSGADDAAVVNVYRTLKLIVDSDAAAADQRVGLMVMGSDEAESRAAADRARAAADEFLRTPIQLVGWQKRMVPVTARELGSFDDLHSLWPRIEAWFETLAQPEVELRDEPAALPPPKPVDTPTPPLSPREPAAPVAEGPRAPQVPQPLKRHSIFTPPLTPRIRTTVPPRPTRRPTTDPVRPATRATPAPGEPSGWRREVAEQVGGGKPPVPTAAATSTVAQPAPPQAPTPAAQRPHRPVADRPPAPAAAALRQPDLASLLIDCPATAQRPLIPGGIALEARCPHQPGTQLLLDQQGRLHLLHRTAPTLAADPATGDPGVAALRGAIVDLLELRGWVQQHLDLIQLTQRQVRIDRDQQPALHLFTDRADLGVPLATRLGGMLKLHLLQEVRLGAAATWFSTPLC